MKLDRFKDTDIGLVIIIAAIFSIALLALYSASHRPNADIPVNYAVKQVLWMGIALCVCILIMRFGYERFLDYGYVIFALNLLLLILVLVAGSTKFGARRWLSIGLFTLQPSELCKISVITALAKYIASNSNRINEKRVLLGALLICLLPMFLIIKQPDLGTAIVFIPVLLVILYVAGAKKRYILSFIIMGLGTLPFLWHILKPYQQKRLLVFLNPDVDPLGAGYTVTQSKIAVGSGGVFGKGWLSGTQNQLNFLPERHTDFIFSVIGEEWGFAGSLLLIVFFILLIRRLSNIANLTHDGKGSILISGIVTLLWFQIFVNISMTIGLMPVVGLPLPLVSYGGSSLMTTMALIGLALSVRQKRKIF